MILGLDAIVCIVGLVIYLVSKESKIQTIGNDMFWVGLLAFLLQGEQLILLLKRISG